MSLKVGLNQNNYISQYAGYNKGLPGANMTGAYGTDSQKVLIAGDRQDDKLMKKLGVIECSTCKNRKYVDKSNDDGVSFKTPTRVSPESSGAAVMSHEQEHVSRENSKAQLQERKVVSQSVRIYTAVCPECGRAYTSGGKTTTTTKADRSSDYFKDNMKKFFEKHYGKSIDIRV